MDVDNATPSVLAVVTQFPAPSQTFILRKLRGLAAAGCPITVAASEIDLAATAAEGFDALPAMPWHRPTKSLSSAGRRGWSAVAKGWHGAHPGSLAEAKQNLLHAPMRSVRTDIVHFEFSGIAVAYRDLLEQLRPARLVVSCRGAAEQIVPLANPQRADELARIFDTVDLIHCVSDDIRRTVESYGAPSRKILVNRPAVPTGDFAPLAHARLTRPRSADSGPLRVLSVGRLHWKKGFDDALRAMSAAGIDVEYRIAGDGPEREKLSFLIDQLGLTGRVELLGRQSTGQVANLLTWADVFLLPSLSEGISNAALEAMAAGLPVVATTCGGMTEVIDDGQTGFLVEVGDVAAMAERLNVLADEPSTRSALGTAAAAHAAKEFDIDRQIQVFLDAYRRLMSEI